MLKQATKILLGAQTAQADARANARAVGIVGMGGVGKTVLATALANQGNAEVRAAFPDGILWLRCGPGARVSDRQNELAYALTGSQVSFRDLKEGSGQLSLLTAGLRLLVVLDDVWEPGVLAGFVGLGAASALLATTRDRRVLDLNGADSYMLDLLAPEEAREFLLHGAGKPRSAMPAASALILNRCGGLPIALAAVAALIRSGTYSWEMAADALREAALGELDTDWLPEEGKADLAAVLRVSVEALNEHERSCFLDCAVIPDGAAVPEAALTRLWSDRTSSERRSKKTIRTLVERSLLSCDEGRFYRLHDLYRTFLLHETGMSLISLHQRVVRNYRTASRDGTWATVPDDGYFFSHFPWHLAQAGEIEQLRALIFDYSWLRAKLGATGFPAAMTDFTLFSAGGEAERLADALRLSAHVVMRDAEQLAGQLLGRLAPEAGPSIARLLAGAHADSRRPALLPVWPCLASPGTALKRMLPGHYGRVEALSPLPDGRRVLSGTSGGTVHLWDIESGIELRRMEGHEGPVVAVAVTPDGRRALSGGWDGTIRLWDLESGIELRCMEGHEQWATAVAALLDGRYALSGSEFGVVRVWDLETGVEVRRLKAHTSRVTAFAVLPCGRYAVSCSDDGTVPLWDIDTGLEVNRLERDSAKERDLARRLGYARNIISVSLLPDGRRILSGGEDGTVRLWDLQTGAQCLHFDGHAKDVTCVAVVKDGRRAVSACRDGTAQLLDIEDNAVLHRWQMSHRQITSLTAMPDGCHVLTGFDDGTIHLWDLDALARWPRPIGHQALVTKVAALPSGERALSGSHDGTLRLWDLETRVEIRCFSGHKSGVSALALLPDGLSAISGSYDGTVSLWNLATGAEVRRREFFVDRQWRTILAVLPDGKRALFASLGVNVQLWDFKTNKVRVCIENNMGAISSLVALPDGRRALLGFWDGTVGMWNIRTGSRLRLFQGHSKSAEAIAVLPGARRALSGSHDGTVRLWDLEGGIELRRLEGHEGSVVAVAATPDGRRALSGGRDKTVRLWDLESGAELAAFHAEFDITSIDIAVGGRVVAGCGTGYCLLEICK